MAAPAQARVRKPNAEAERFDKRAKAAYSKRRCDDADCAADAACAGPDCSTAGAFDLGCACGGNADCASNRCKGKRGSMTCK